MSWNKYRSEITTQPKNNNFDYMIDLTFRNVDRMFVLSFKNGDNDPARNSFEFMPLVETKDFNALDDNKLFFFFQPTKDKQKVYKKLVETSRNNDYTTGNLSDNSHIKININSLIGIDLSRQTNAIIPQQINFTGKLKMIV